MKDNNNKNTFRDELRVEGVLSRGYGIINKMAMLDRKLTIEAKGIYSYFCSYAGAGNQAFPSVKKIYSDLCISEGRYYKHFGLLKTYGYITVESRTNKRGQFESNLYTLVQKPIENIEESLKVEKEKKDKKRKSNLPNIKEKKPYIDFDGVDKDTCSMLNNVNMPSAQNPCTENPCTDFEGTNNNNLFKINNLSNSISLSVDEKTDMTEDIKIVKNVFKERIGYEALIEMSNEDTNIDSNMVKDVFNIIIDMYFSKYTKIGTELKQQELVQSALFKLDHWKVHNIIVKLKKVNNVKSMKNYLNTIIYNEVFEYNANLQNEINT